ncbi:hypothetical protein [Paraburkholderia humisilvae]|uniref:Uncharacterized protein n=1 Tax=Paraburkholderia humisilvae TaxID=627669 RepID=A0A6J5DNY2_9BURK|nr:hypothetical protein [Paraburkholderia humisilvae]CAB3754912.1 hypothetical protein LMG29542_02487 [Paraburkholderia humisilvae]
MFTAIRARWFEARVRAELKAQHNDQAFVNAAFKRLDIAREMERMRGSALARGKPGAFLIACKVLAINAADPENDPVTQMLCASLLSARLQKARSNPSFHDAFSGYLDEVETLSHDAIGRNRGVT